VKKKVIVFGVTLLVAVVSVVVADYFTLLGTSETPEYVLQELRIRPVNKHDNSPIEGTRVKCFQTNNRNACTQRDSGKLGIVSVMVPSIRISTNSLLFEKGHRFLASKDPKVQVMLINLDYINVVESIEVQELFDNPGKIYKVLMEPRQFNDPENT
jgi:hypothetical protein